MTGWPRWQRKQKITHQWRASVAPFRHTVNSSLETGRRKTIHLSPGRFLPAGRSVAMPTTDANAGDMEGPTWTKGMRVTMERISCQPKDPGLQKRLGIVERIVGILWENSESWYRAPRYATLRHQLLEFPIIAHYTNGVTYNQDMPGVQCSCAFQTWFYKIHICNTRKKS